MGQDSDRDGSSTRGERLSTKIVFPRVLVIGTETFLRNQLIERVRTRGIKTEALDSGIGSLQKIVEESLNTVVIMDVIDAMSPESVIKLLRNNPRTQDVGIIAFVDPRAEPPEGADKTFGKGTLSSLTDVIVDVCEMRAKR